jgi:hypothetical protein
VTHAIPLPHASRLSVLSRTDVEQVLLAMARPSSGAICPQTAVLARLLYATGMRVSEAVRLRTRDVDVEAGTIVVRDRRGVQLRVLKIPPALEGVLRQQCSAAGQVWHGERPRGVVPGAAPPAARPSPADTAPTGWLFPSPVLSREPRTGLARRHHVHEKRLLRDLAAAMQRCGLAQPASAHTLRDAFAAHALQAGVDLRVLREALGPDDPSLALLQAWAARDGAGAPDGAPCAEAPGLPASAPSDPARGPLPAFRRRSVHEADPLAEDAHDGLDDPLDWPAGRGPYGVEQPAAPWHVAIVPPASVAQPATACA